MKILWITFSDMVAQAIVQSVNVEGEHDVRLLFYNRVGTPTDQHMLRAVEEFKPDVAIYFGMAGGPLIPQPETLKAIRRKTRLVHILGDASDPDWWPLLNQYALHECFDCTVNIDGNPEWPAQEHDLTLLTPHDPRFYLDPRPLVERPIPFGFCGGYASPSRARIINHLIEKRGLVINPRNEQYGHYDDYANFMMSCRIIPNVPFSGPDHSMQVKGRVLESGLARCVLLDHEQSAAKRWFTPGVDYVTYSTPESAAEMVDYLQSIPIRMQEIADNLSRKVRENHSAKQFWDAVFKEAMR